MVCSERACRVCSERVCSERVCSGRVCSERACRVCSERVCSQRACRVCSERVCSQRAVQGVQPERASAHASIKNKGSCHLQPPGASHQAHRVLREPAVVGGCVQGEVQQRGVPVGLHESAVRARRRSLTLALAIKPHQVLGACVPLDHCRHSERGGRRWAGGHPDSS